jgi:hypothetical protein
VTGHRSNNCDQSLTQIVLSRPRSMKRGRAASSTLALAKEQGQCERQRLTKSPVGDTLLDCERAENRRRPQSRASRPDHSACLDVAEHAHPRDRGSCAETHAQRPRRTRTEGVEGENIVGEGRRSSRHINDGLLHGRHLQSRQSLGKRYPSPNGRREQCDAGFHPFDSRRRSPSVGLRRARERQGTSPSGDVRHPIGGHSLSPSAGVCHARERQGTSPSGHERHPYGGHQCDRRPLSPSVGVCHSRERQGALPSGHERHPYGGHPYDSRPLSLSVGVNHSRKRHCTSPSTHVCHPYDCQQVSSSAEAHQPRRCCCHPSTKGHSGTEAKYN